MDIINWNFNEININDIIFNKKNYKKYIKSYNIIKNYKIINDINYNKNLFFIKNNNFEQINIWNNDYWNMKNLELP